MTELPLDWKGLDTAHDQVRFIEYLDIAQNHNQFQRLRQQTYAMLGQARGKGIDVGCGLGMAVDELNKLGFDVVGLDYSPIMIENARKRYSDLQFCTGNVELLPFDHQSIDFYRAERVFVHLSVDQTVQALNEAFRTLRPRGTIVLAEPDLSTMTLTCTDENLPIARAITNSMCKAMPSGRAGTFLAGMLRNSGFSNVVVNASGQVISSLDLANHLAIDLAINSALTSGTVSRPQIDSLKRDMLDFDRQNMFQFSCSAFIISGQRM
jgi:ubiquinone/menaquinone biosynthesis C-methylase UbiE